MTALAHRLHLLSSIIRLRVGGAGPATTGVAAMGLAVGGVGNVGDAAGVVAGGVAITWGAAVIGAAAVSGTGRRVTRTVAKIPMTAAAAARPSHKPVFDVLAGGGGGTRAVTGKTMAAARGALELSWPEG